LKILSLVFKGKYQKQEVALKIFKNDFINQEDNVNFSKELQLISKLKHQNVVNFIGYIAENNKFGIVLEYCKKKNLKTFIEKNLKKKILFNDKKKKENYKKKKFDFKKKLKLLLDISKGMDYLHFKDIIHRDLKLENILITKDSIAKISDFGISRTVDDRTKTKCIGTPLYMVIFYFFYFFLFF
jgi:serine/threonine protein kinase